MSEAKQGRSVVRKIATRLQKPVRADGADLVSKLYFLERDAANKARYGILAPTSAALVYVDPRNITKTVHPRFSLRIDSGRIRGGDWDLDTHSVKSLEKVRGIKEHVVKGLPWEATTAWKQCLDYLDRGTGLDGITSLKDIERRYKQLDKFILAVETRREAGFKTRKEMDPRNFREASGVMINIGRNGDLIFSRRGCHRVGIAQAFGLTCMPAQLGIVHPDAIRSGVWKKHLIDRNRAEMIRRSAASQTPPQKAKPKPRPAKHPKSYYTGRYHTKTKSTSVEWGANKETHWNAELVEKFSRLNGILPGKSVVEIGAAEGILSLTIAPHMDRVRAIEITPVRNERAIELKNRWLELGKNVENCEMVLGDVFADPGLIKGFDTLLASRVVYYFGDRLDEFMRNVATSVTYICLIGNPVRSRRYFKGNYQELGEEFARYTTIPGMKELVERYGFEVIHEDPTLDPLIIAKKIDG